MTSGVVWRWVRVGLMGLAFLSSLLSAAPRVTPMPATLVVGRLVLGVVVTPILMVLVLSLVALGPRSRNGWTYPAWSDSLLRVFEPLRGFHFGAFMIGSSALGAAAANVIDGRTDYWPVVGIGLAAGMWIGVNVAWRLHPAQEVPPSNRSLPTRGSASRRTRG